MERELTYVYFIQRGRGAVKIGVSADPAQRLKELQTGSQNQLMLIAKIPCETRRKAQLLEAELHNEFSEFRMWGEWFHRRFLRSMRHRSKIFKGGTGVSGFEPIE